MRRILVPLVILVGLLMAQSGLPAIAQSDCQTFPETGKTVCGVFLTYWKTHGGLAQQGFPISNVIKEVSSDGKTYDTQYFERAVFELHPENRGTPYEVLLSLVGRERFDRRYPAGLPAGETPLEVGQTVTMAGNNRGGTFRVAITGVERVGSVGTTNAKGIFVLIELQVTNLGNQPDRLTYFRLKDQQGRIFTAAIADDRAVQPSLTDTARVWFDVALDATTFTILPPAQ